MNLHKGSELFGLVKKSLGYKVRRVGLKKWKCLMPMFIFFVLHHVLAQEFLHLTCLPKSLPAVVLSRALLNSLSSQRQSCSLSAHHSGSQQTALLCQIVSHLTLQIDRTLLSRHLGLFLWIHSNLSPSVY